MILDDKRNNIIFQTLFKHNHSAHTAVSVLKWVDSLKLHIEI